MARELLSVSSISINDLNDAVVSGTAPSNPDEGMLWLNDKVLKQYTNGTWKTVTLDISKMDEVLAETVRSMKETLGNISNDGILTFIDRQTIASNVGSIIGEMPSTSAESMAVLPSYTALDSKGTGTFAFLRHTARDIGMDEESTFFKEMQDTYTNLVSYISSTTPKMWDISTANKDKVITLSDKDTFNGYWLNYFLAEGIMSGEIDRLANIKLDEMTKGSSVQDKDETTGEGITFTNNGDKDGRVYPTVAGANFPKIGNTGKNMFNVREFVASRRNKNYYSLHNTRHEEDDVLVINTIDGRGFDRFDYDIPVKPSTTYTISHKRPMSLRVAELNSSGALLNSLARNDELYSHTFKTSSSTSSIRFKFITNATNPAYIPQVQLEVGSNATKYEPNISINYPVKPKQMDNFYLVGSKGKENTRTGNENNLNSTGNTTLVSAVKVDGYEDWSNGEDVYEIRANSTGGGAIFYGDTDEYRPDKEVTESIKINNIGPNPVIIHSNGIVGPNSNPTRLLPGEEKLAVFNGVHRNNYNFTQLHISPRADIPDGKNYLMNSGSPSALDFMSNNSRLYPITKGVEGGVDWIESNWLEQDGFLLSTYVQQNYQTDSNFSTTGPYDPYLKGYTGPITYSIDIMSEYPMTVNFGISTSYSEEVTLVPGKWTRLSYTNNKGLSDTRPGSLFSNRDGANKDIPNKARIYWRKYKIEKGSLSDGTANGLYAPQGSEAGNTLVLLATNHTYNYGGYTPFARRMVNIAEGEPTTSIIKHRIRLEDGLRHLSETYHDSLYYDYTDNLWKIKRMTGELKLDGTENYGYALESSWTGKSSFRMSGYANGMNENTNELISTHFRYSDTGQITSSNLIGEFGRNNVKGVRAHNILFVTAHTTLAQFKSWLKSESDKGTPVTIWYELKEPQIEVLSEEIQNQLNNIYTYEGSSYLWTDSPLNPKITATFKSQAYTRNKETKDNLDSKLDKDDYNPDDIIAQSVTATWDNYGDMIEGTVSQLTTYESRVETLQTLFSQTQETFNFNFNALTTTLGDNQTANDENFSKISKFIRFEGGNILLGEEGSSTFLEIAKDKITFNNGGSEVAYISNQTMEITHGIFVQTATIAGMRIQRIPGSNNIGFTVIQ